MNNEINLRRPFDLSLFEQIAPEWAGRAFYLAEIGSTNQEARERLREKPQEFLVLTDRQSAGRGRLGRSWQAPVASGLLCTLAFRLSPLPLERAFLYTAALALSVVRAVADLQPGAGVALKWPNDVLRGGKKAGGILAELENNLGVEANESWLALGFGLNISLSQSDLTEAGLSDKATNLTEKPLEREALLANILKHFSHYRTKLSTTPDKVRQEWAAALVTLGQEVQVLNYAGELQLTGLATAVAENGALIIQDSDGRQHYLQAGDVSVRLPNGSYSA